MAFIYLALALVVLGFLYIRMIRRETPSPISNVQALVPVALGVAALPLSFACVLGLGTGMNAAGISFKGLPTVLRSIMGAFMLAGLPEELAKFAMMLIAFAIFRRKLRNVYEAILIGAGVGIGFTLFEEFTYGSGGDVASLVVRVVTVAAHMVFGIIMGRHLGLARVNGQSKGGQIALAILLPVAIHTLYDAFTGTNMLFLEEQDSSVMLGLGLSLVATVALLVLIALVLLRVKRNADRYYAMTF